MRLTPIFALALLTSLGCGGTTYDVVIRGGTVYNGSDSAGVVADIAIQGDSIVAVGNLGEARGRQVIDAKGLAVAPGFINMLSWANEALLVDGKSQSDIRQGVTLEIFGEGESMGPLTPAMKAEWEAAPGPRWRVTSIRWCSGVSRPMSPRSSARPQCGSMSWATIRARPPSRSSLRCSSWSARRWPTARSVSAAP
jgi:hypothetical protein